MRPAWARRTPAWTALLGLGLAASVGAVEVRKPGSVPPPASAAPASGSAVPSVPSLPGAAVPLLPAFVEDEGLAALPPLPGASARPAPGIEGRPALPAAAPEGPSRGEAPVPAAAFPELLPGQDPAPALDAFYDLSAVGPDESGVVALPDAAPAASGLSAASPGAEVSAPPPAPSRGPRGRRLLRGLKDRLDHRRIWLHQLWWYTVTHIMDRGDPNMWPAYHRRWREARDAGRPMPVSDPRRFFAHMRVMGESGVFYVLGFSSLREGLVIEEARETFERYFDHPAVGERGREAFEAFLRRAYSYNLGKRAHSNFRKHVRDALLGAAQVRPEMVAEFLDGRRTAASARETAVFQREESEAVLAAFRGAVLDTIAEEDPAASDRVLAAVLLGSFAIGSPSPDSDLDLELVTADGRSGRMAGFGKRLKARWQALGLDRHPVSIHVNADPPSRGLIQRIFNTEYLVLSPDEALVAELSRAPGEPPVFAVQRERSWKGRFGRWAQFLAVYASTLLADLRDSL